LNGAAGTSLAGAGMNEDGGVAAAAVADGGTTLV